MAPLATRLSNQKRKLELKANKKSLLLSCPSLSAFTETVFINIPIHWL